ncbi:hypothetical protein B0H19DRAFT_1166230 [Mycena capillaripes]|nr:hypothetical protein B0H19DRAFT_1166230 [Mycena capillaripes]
MSSTPNAWERPWWLSFLDRTNITVTGLTAFAILLTRSAGVAYFGAGALACSISVQILKGGIRQPRPVLGKKKTYGMPSTHSATIAYYSAYVPLACMGLPLHPSIPGGEAARVIAPILLLPWAALIAMSRIWLQHHTYKQVAFGVLYGVAFAGMWFALWTRTGLNELGRDVEELVNSFLEWR